MKQSMNQSASRTAAFQTLFLASALLLLIEPVYSQTEAPQQRRRGAGAPANVLNSRLTVHWNEGNTKFWYRRELLDAGREFILVDTTEGTRQPAFDHAAVAEQLSKQLDKEFTATQLPFSSISINEANNSILLIGAEGRFRWDKAANRLTKVERGDAPEEADGLVPESNIGRSTRTGPESGITFENQLAEAVSIFWVDTSGNQQSYGEVAPQSNRTQHTFSGHRWLVKNAQGDRLAVFEATDDPATAIINGKPAELRAAPRGDRPPRRRREPNRDQSPDGKWRAFIEDHNLFVQSIEENDSAEKSTDPIQLSEDGNEQSSYRQFEWSPDSQHLIAFRVDEVEIAQVHLLQSSPPEGGRAVLQSRTYALPGDKFPKHELNIFHVKDRKQVKPEVDRLESEWERPSLRWNQANNKFTYRIIDRGHQRLRVVQIDPATATVENVVDEKSKTFVWTMHIEDLQLRLLNWMEQSDELIYVSEQSGWRHMYLVNADRPGELKPITSGDWVVRGIQQIDEAERTIWFSASGVFADQDPYLVHYGRVHFDGSGLTWLTAGHGMHTLQYSPDRRFVIDSFSRVDLPPQHELRRVDDGQLVCALESADTTQLEASGWKAPEVFSAKGRDGKTDIWGVVYRPQDFNPEKKYAVIEDIYAGPQGAFVPKTFNPGRRYQALNELGFIVVKIDGMGTANRSKAFHDVCWQNLKDGGFEDRIAWMKAAGEKYPEMDLERVGIYGVSAGGQNAAAAVLFHPEFYKAAVAGCGCHDNRMDKASWNEQWMGYPVGPHYAECSNIDNAHRLQGNLMLIVGELDDNVPPESTIRFADALIQAEKDFDLVVVPNAGHGIGGSYGERRMRDFFVRHLLGETLPNRNQR